MTTQRTAPMLQTIAALFFSLLLALSLFPLGALADEPLKAQADGGTSGDCSWAVDSSGKLTIKPTDGKSGELGAFEYTAPWTFSNATSVVIEPGVVAPASCSNMFALMRGLKSADLSGLDTSKVTDMSFMFMSCGSLTSVKGFTHGTGSVTNMSNMFSGCDSLKSVDLSDLNTSKVTLMNGMFSGCSSLVSANVSGFSTSEVETMTGMFNGCSALKALNLSHFDTAKVIEFGNMFKDCTRLESLDISSFNTAEAGNMMGMFSGCKSLTKLDLSHFSTAKVTTMSQMFENCSYLEELNLSSFDTLNIQYMKGMLDSCTALTRFTVGKSFSFISKTEPETSNCELPEGNWLSTVDNKVFTAAQITADRSRIADTYVKNGTPVESKPDEPSKPEDPSKPADPDDSGKDVVETITIYRLYNPNSGEHFYTEDEHEREVLIGLGWNNEDIGWYAPTSGAEVYRVYNPNAGGHFYTESAHERNTLVDLGWRYEGVCWYSYSIEDVPLYRVYNPNQYAFNHFWTANLYERDVLVGLGWQNEGIGWYAVAGGTN